MTTKQAPTAPPDPYDELCGFLAMMLSGDDVGPTVLAQFLRGYAQGLEEIPNDR